MTPFEQDYHRAHVARVARLGGMPARVMRMPVVVVPVAPLEREPSPEPKPQPIKVTPAERRYPLRLPSLPGGFRTQGPQPQRAPYRGIAAWRIKRRVGTIYGFTDEELSSVRRTIPLVWIRHIAVYLVHRHTQLSPRQIAQLFGNRDHTTVVHGTRKVALLREIDPVVAAELDYLESVIFSV